MNQINFIPETYLKARRRRGTLARSGVLLSTTAGLIVAWFLLTPAHYIEALEAYAATLDEQILAAEEAADDRATDAAASRELQELISLRESLAPAVPATWVVGAIASAMPPAMGLTSMSVVTEIPDDETGGSRASAGVEAIAVHLEGLAPDDVTIARFIGGLDAQPLFDGVELGFSRPVEEGTLVAREFRITTNVPLDRTFELAADGKERAHAD